MERYPTMKVVVVLGKASWVQEVLEKMEASTRVIPAPASFPVSAEPEVNSASSPPVATVSLDFPRP
jgi:hypothetical protein